MVETPGVEVVSVPALREKDFGPWEGLKFGARLEGHDEVLMSGAETGAAMASRVRPFVDTLEALGLGLDWDGCVAVVAHGIILGILAKALATRFPGGSMLPLGAVGTLWDDHRLSLRNTGYLEAVVRPARDAAGQAVQLSILAINCTSHLDGLKKTRGGIGSARFDETQKTIDSFFSPSRSNQPGDGPAAHAL